MQDFRKLRVWQLARRLSQLVTDALPERRARRVPGLRTQAIRSAMSVRANLAEGCGRSTRKDFLHFVEIALASTNELQDQLIAALDAKVISFSVHAQLQSNADLVRRMLVALIRTLQRAIADEETARRDKDSRNSQRQRGDQPQ
ncbi:MAG: four helix bundle protein [Gemmatimonadaceae bacterium]